VQYEDRLTIATPEGVELELTLAGLGSRFVAGIADQVLKLLLIGLLALLLLGAEDVGAAVFVPAVALVLFGYDVLFELLWRGRTPGKRWAGLRVVRGGGAPVDARSSAVRNLLRLVDGWPLVYLPTIVSILVTRRNQRLGDLAADTVVVRERHVAVAQGPPPAAGAGVPAPAWDVSAVGPEDLAALRGFLARRGDLDPAARDRVARGLDAALRPKVGGADEPHPERFLEGVAAAKLSRAQ
jgi:uncharacterized RDD family membrane protein YckC